MMNKGDKNNVDWIVGEPFGLARGASFNEIDRAVIEMRTKLARDNTRPLISAARPKNVPADRRTDGRRERLFLANLSVFMS